MEPAPPRAPLSIRVWGWIILVSSVLNLIAFSTSMMGSFTSGQPALSTVGVLAFLVTLATGIGFVSGWSWSWYSGLLIAIGGLAFGVWYLQQIRGSGASEMRPVFAVIWLGPSLLLLLCLLLPGTVRWMRGGDQPWRWPMPPPGMPAAPSPLGGPPPARPSLLLPLLVFVAAATGAGLILWLGRGAGDFPEHAAGFRLARSLPVNAGTIFGPPVSQMPDPTPEKLVHRLAVYESGDVSAEVRLFGIDLSRWPHETLLLSAGLRISSDEPGAGADPITAASVNGVRYTCARVRRGAACVWTDGDWTGWARSDGSLDPDRLRSLASSVHAAAT